MTDIERKKMEDRQGLPQAFSALVHTLPSTNTVSPSCPCFSCMKMLYMTVYAGKLASSVNSFAIGIVPKILKYVHYIAW